MSSNKICKEELMLFSYSKSKSNKLIFKGYLKANNKILYSSEAKEYLKYQLNENSVEDIFKNINGSFHFVYFNDEILYFGVDHFGDYSLFYDESTFEIHDNPSEHYDSYNLSDTDVLSLLTSGFTIGENTVFENIKYCLPGILYQYDFKKQQLRKTKWFPLKNDQNTKYDRMKLDKIFVNSFPDDLGDKKLLLPLTAGIDSRLILSFFLKKKYDFQTFTYGHSQEKDVKVAKKISSDIGVKHRFYRISEKSKKQYFTEKDFQQLINRVFLGNAIPHESDWMVIKSLKENSIVTLGRGGNWLSGDYNDFTRKITCLPKAIDYIIHKEFNLTGFSSKHNKQVIKNKVIDHFGKIFTTKFSKAKTIWELHNKGAKYTPQKTYLRNNVDIYMPLHDRKIAEYFLNLKEKWLINEYAYFDYAKNYAFCGDFYFLKSYPTTRKNYHKQEDKFIKERLKIIWENVDYKRNLKKIIPSKNSHYKKAFYILFGQNNKNFLNKRVIELFPKISLTADYLYNRRCKLSSHHLHWLKNQRIGQLTTNGLYLCKMLPYIFRLV